MVAVRNKGEEDLELPFEGNTYVLPKQTTVFVADDVGADIRTRWPLSFDFEVKVTKDKPVPKARFYKTKSLFEEVEKESALDMRVSRGKMKAEMLSPDAETQSPDFYGPGIETESLDSIKEE